MRRSFEISTFIVSPNFKGVAFNTDRFLARNALCDSNEKKGAVDTLLLAYSKLNSPSLSIFGESSDSTSDLYYTLIAKFL